jgi:hypothetical protein
VNVRRLAAIDMYGTSGTSRRRRIILAEFTAGLAAMVALGSWLVAGASSPGTRLLGIWILVPLSLVAIAAITRRASPGGR